MKTGIFYSHPWMLLLLIPALLLAFIPYFKVTKKYRRNRNRVTSLVLYLIVAFLTINLLAGFRINYSVSNNNNEIILLVDVSNTENQSKDDRDGFVETLLRAGKYDNYKVGVVTFGFTQKYAVPLTYDVAKIYEKYESSLDDLPDITATDIASALTYTKGLFEHPESAKIVLITDGKETDLKAASVARAISSSGVKIDIAYIPSEYEDKDVQILSVSNPEYHVNTNEECTFRIQLQCKGEDTVVNIQLTDNDSELESGRSLIENKALTEGLQEVEISYTFLDEGIHKLDFTVETEGGETVVENNRYTTFMSIEKFNKVLLIERDEDPNDVVEGILTADEAFHVETLNFYESDEIPDSVSLLCEYDQVILNNVSVNDMEEKWGEEKAREFQEVLHTYVNEKGGSLFTIGGDDDNGDANFYDRHSMEGSLLQQMLPVQAIDYTPPLGVVIIIDKSGSMSDIIVNGNTREDRLWWAKAGAQSCLNSTESRDYMGIMTLDDNNEVVLELTPRTQREKIIEAIESIEEANGGTIATNALKSAGIQLNAQSNIDNKHIIIVTDGEFGDTDNAVYACAANYRNGITISIVVVGDSTIGKEKSLQLIAAGHGEDPDAIVNGSFRDYSQYEQYLYNDDKKIVYYMRESLNIPEIKDVVYEDFTPTVRTPSSVLVKDLGEMDEETHETKLPVTVSGFYGTKARNNIDLVLVGPYEVPLYAQWKFGKGMVGSLMCDLGGKWGSDLSGSDIGQQFIRNAVGNLMPTEDIRVKSIVVDLREDNYTNQIYVYSDLKDGETIVGTIKDATDEDAEEIKLLTPENPPDTNELFYITEGFAKENSFGRSAFILKKSGVYKITISKVDQNGNVLDTVEKYKTFSYSEEYDTFPEENEEMEIRSNLETIAKRGLGSIISDLEEPNEVFKDFVTRLPRTFDPRYLFIIISIVLFLLDIIVRKFKFKWPHEIIAMIKEKRANK